MSKTREQSDHWGDCPPGVLQQMVAGNRSKQRLATTKRFASALAVLLLVGVGAWTALQFTLSNRGHLVGGIPCADCVQLMADYRGQRLDPGRAAEVRDHLAGCGTCREKYESMGSEARRSDELGESQASLLSNVDTTSPRWLALASWQADGH